MERILNISKTASCLLAAIVVCQTGIALLLTYLANATNTRGLGVIAFALWLVVAVVAGLLYRRKLPSLVLFAIICAAFFLSFIAYILIGYFGLGWTGLMKGRNG